MFPTTYEIDEEKDIETVEKPMGKVFLFDFKNKCHVLKDGKPVLATYAEAVQQWLTMLLITEVGKYVVYQDTDFGMELGQFIGRRDLPLGVVLSEVSRQIEEKALEHPEIEEVSNFSIDRDRSYAIISFDVVTKQGVIEGIQSEVKYSGANS